MNRDLAISASRAKNEFGRLLDAALQGQTVTITRHAAPRAVLLSVERYRALCEAPSHRLDTLADEFDAMLARMQRPAAQRGLLRAFGATPRQLGRAAVTASRKRA